MRDRAAGVLVFLLVGLGCAPAPRSGGIASEAPSRGERVALLPLDNLTDRPEASRLYTQILADRITGEGLLDLSPMVDVDAALNALRVRRTDRIDSTTVRSLGDSLGVRYLLAGAVLDLRDGNSFGGSDAEVTVTLRMVHVRGGRTIWTCVDARSGADGEGPFGWGRTASGQKLAVESASAIAEKLYAYLHH